MKVLNLLNKVVSLPVKLELAGVAATLKAFRSNPNKAQYAAAMDAIRSRRTEILNQLARRS